MTMVAADSGQGVMKHQGIMSIKELATYMGKSVGWVYANKDELPHRRIGRLYFFDRGAIDDWLKGDRPVQSDDREAIRTAAKKMTKSIMKKR
jgi:excisionase family DNA binding protein